MKKSSEDMLGLVNALLEVYKYDAEKLVLNYVDFNIYDLTKQVYDELKPLADNKNIEFLIESTEKAIEINPNYTLAYFNLARAYQTIGNKAKAAEYYQMTMDLNKITEELSEKDIRKRLFELFD